MPHPVLCAEGRCLPKPEQAQARAVEHAASVFSWVPLELAYHAQQVFRTLSCPLPGRNSHSQTLQAKQSPQRIPRCALCSCLFSSSSSRRRCLQGATREVSSIETCLPDATPPIPNPPIRCAGVRHVERHDELSQIQVALPPPVPNIPDYLAPANLSLISLSPVPFPIFSTVHPSHSRLISLLCLLSCNAYNFNDILVWRYFLSKLASSARVATSSFSFSAPRHPHLACRQPLST